MVSTAGSRRLSVAIAALLFVLVLGLPAPSMADCPGKIENGARVDVTLDFDTGTIHVSPESVTIYLQEGEGKPGRVCWAVHGLGKEHTLHIAGKPGEQSFFPSAERTVKQARDFADSGRPGQAGTWRYELRVTQDGVDGNVLVKDPEVIIRPGG